MNVFWVFSPQGAPGEAGAAGASAVLAEGSVTTSNTEPSRVAWTVPVRQGGTLEVWVAAINAAGNAVASFGFLVTVRRGVGSAVLVGAVDPAFYVRDELGLAEPTIGVDEGDITIDLVGLGAIISWSVLIQSKGGFSTN